MGAFKWIFGLIGWASGGPIGALIGVLLGGLVEGGADAIKQLGGGNIFGNGTGDGTGGFGNPWGNSQNTGGYNRNTGSYNQSSGTTGGYTRQPGGYSASEQRNSFMVSLLVLSSAVIRADGKYLQSEYDYVRQYLRSNFGAEAEDEGMRILKELNLKEINVYSVGTQIKFYMNYSQRLQLFHYLADLANADGEFCDAEKSVLQAIASAIGINSSDAESILAMFSKAKESAYTILEISPSASVDEIKSAYRRLAMKYHPDKVATLGPDVQKAAEEKFRKIQEAYETIKKERGIN